jgi:hypothetical protein
MGKLGDGGWEGHHEFYLNTPQNYVWIYIMVDLWLISVGDAILVITFVNYCITFGDCGCKKMSSVLTSEYEVYALQDCGIV